MYSLLCTVASATTNNPELSLLFDDHTPSTPPHIVYSLSFAVPTQHAPLLPPAPLAAPPPLVAREPFLPPVPSFPSVQVVGATGSTTIAFILPGLLYLKIHPEPHPTRSLAALQLVVGLFIIPVALTFIALGDPAEGRR